jgi:hypothetical protein
MNKTNLVPRSKEEVTRILQEWEGSNLSKKAFCQQRQINYQTFIGWIVKRRNRSALNESRFIPVQVEHKPSGVFAEIYLSGSRKIILHSAVDADFIRTVLKC